MIFAKIGFCIVLMAVVIVRFIKGGKKLSELHALLIASGLVLVVLPQEFIKSEGILQVIDIMGLVVTLIGVGMYIVMKALNRKKKGDSKKQGQTDQKEKKH